VRQRDHERELARLRAQHEAAERERREAAARELKQQRREIVQRVKDGVVGGWSSWGYTIPPEAKARVLAEIEKELSGLPVEELPESELRTISEGIRDRIYQPLIQAQDRQRKQEERRAKLVELGVSYASRELQQEPDLDGWTRLEIGLKIKQTLEHDVRGTESEGDIRASVDELLGDELDAVEEQKREKARPNLILHGAAYARRELARETDLDGLERWQIQQEVKGQLEREITGEESDRDVEALVDDILDEKLGEPEDDGEGF